MLVTEKYKMDNGRDHAIAAGCLQLVELTHTFYVSINTRLADLMSRPGPVEISHQQPYKVHNCRKSLRGSAITGYWRHNLPMASPT